MGMVERVSVFVRESESDPNWVQHFALLPRVPRVGEFIRCEGDDESDAPWYRVERVLRIPPDDSYSDDEETWSAMVFAVRRETISIGQTPEPAIPERHQPITAISLPTPVPFPPLSEWGGYPLATVTVLLAVLINGAILHFAGTYVCFLLFVLSIAIVTALRGWKVGVFGALLATVAVLFFFVEPICTFSIARSEDGYRLAGFSLIIFTACFATYASQQLADKRALL